MTIIVAVKFAKGVVVATDSRTTYGEADFVRDIDRKIETLNEKVALTSTGITAVHHKIAKGLQTYMKADDSRTFDDIVQKCEDLTIDFRKRYGARMKEDEKEGEDWTYCFHLYSSDRMVEIDSSGIAGEEECYLIDGSESGSAIAEYILLQRYKPDLTEQECKELATYVVLQAKKVDPSVGGPVNLCVIGENGIGHVSRQEIDEIVENVTEMSPEQQLKLQRLVGEIVDSRRWTNDLFQHKFKMGLFVQEECAILEIQKTCRNEDDFTNRIAALALLAENMGETLDVDKELGDKAKASINRLEVFAKKYIPNLAPGCITNFHDIRNLRSQKMPIHEDHHPLIPILKKWGFKVPINWGNLWELALTKYRDSLEMIKEAIQ